MSTFVLNFVGKYRTFLNYIVLINDNQTLKFCVFIRLRQYAVDTLRQELCLVSRYRHAEFYICCHIISNNFSMVYY